MRPKTNQRMLIMKLRGKFAAVSIAALCIAGATVTTAASSETDETSPDVVTVVTSPMYLVHVTGVVNSEPDSDGNILVSLSNGAEVPIPADLEDEALTYSRSLEATTAKLSGSATTDAIVTGPCGNSSVVVKAKSNGKPVRMETGFSLIANASWYTWSVQIAGDSGTGYAYSYHASGSLANRSNWSGSHNSGSNYPTGNYAASVDGPASYAMLSGSGDICYSGGPYDHAYLNG